MQYETRADSVREPEQPFRTDDDYYQGRADGIATTSAIPVAEARRELARRHGFSTWDELMALPQKEVTTDIHCVTRWSKLDTVWRGVPVTEVLDRAGVKDGVTHVMAYSDGGYTTNMPLEVITDADVLLAPESQVASALQRLGAAPFPKSRFPFLGFLATVYDHVAAHAMGRARRRDDSSPQ